MYQSSNCNALRKLLTTLEKTCLWESRKLLNVLRVLEMLSISPFLYAITHGSFLSLVAIYWYGLVLFWGSFIKCVTRNAALFWRKFPPTPFVMLNFYRILPLHGVFCLLSDPASRSILPLLGPCHARFFSSLPSPPCHAWHNLWANPYWSRSIVFCHCPVRYSRSSVNTD